ncbi:hypothetical protein L484_022809 [Morus notabilis]|uniref:Uncharacterized protein n=1 Tax=Morus notabilis TaxID=981085 RepID=W9SD63_9ROSA|nr:hypothetical protein L484_022809 [Morus notabilis]
MNRDIEASIRAFSIHGSSLSYSSFSPSPTKKTPMLILAIGDSTMTGKAKRKKHKAKEIAVKIYGFV